PLKSPLKGVIQRRDLSPGDTVGSDETPITVVNTCRMWVMVDAFERDIPLLQLGQKIELNVRSIPGRTFRGAVDWISRELEKETRTVQIRAIIENPEHILRAGMFGTALIHTAKLAEATIVPVDAVQTVEEKNVIFVPGDEEGSFKPVPVTLGEESDGWVEIVSGLKPGVPVVTAGAFHLKAAVTAGKRSAAHGH
ncbi:MAG: efflux RND transporter periplasmic adaptor subunit, partial [bacterium]